MIRFLLNKYTTAQIEELFHLFSGLSDTLMAECGCITDTCPNCSYCHYYRLCHDLTTATKFLEKNISKSEKTS